MVYLYEKWSAREKRKLARLLTVYPLDAYESIAAKLPGKSTEEVKTYIKKMIHSTKVHMTLQKHKYHRRTEQKAPLESWLDVSKSLVESEQFDFSSCLSKVMSFISSFEEFPEGLVNGHDQPDYRAIYKYLAHVLDGSKQEEEELGSLEASIVLDLIHSLMEVMSENDLLVQTNVMRWKYQLINERNDHGHPIAELLQKASENDFKEFIEIEEKNIANAEERERENAEQIERLRKAREKFQKLKELEENSSTVEAGTSTDTCIASTSTYTATPSTSMGGAPKPGTSTVTSETGTSTDTCEAGTSTVTSETGTSTDTCEAGTSTAATDTRTIVSTCEAGTSTAEPTTDVCEISENHEDGEEAQPLKIVARYVYEADYTTANKSHDPKCHINTSVYHNKPGRKSHKNTFPATKVTEIVHVVPPKNATIVKMKPRPKKRTVRDDGKYFGIDVTNPEKESEIPSKEALEGKEKTHYLALQHKLNEQEKLAELRSLREFRKRKYQVLGKKKDSRKAVKKPKLYSLNPFCLPINLLDLSS